MQTYETVLKQYFGFDHFRDNQKAIIKSIIEDKKDTVAILFTGAGKSLCFQFPPVYTGKTALVVSPLIALMNDQKMKLDKQGIPSICLNSSVSNKPMIQKNILENKYRIVYTTPEYIVKNERFIQQLIDFDILCGFFIDEAHAVSNWGNNFREDYKKLSCLRDWAPHIPMLCLTATATTAVKNDIVKILNLDKPVVIKSTFDRPNLIIKVLPKGILPIKDLLSVIKKEEPTIIYCQKRADCDDLSQALNKNGIKCESYHAGMHDADRNAVHVDFAEGRINFVVCTIAFGMGIDIVIRKVINYGIPSDMESYYQQIGRAGRDGLPSECILFYKLSDMNNNNYFINQISNTIYRNHMMELSKSVKNYVFSTECRRKYILEYFSEQYTKENCGACDNCFNKKDIVIQDLTLESKALFEAITATNNSVGSGIIILIVRGSANKKVLPSHKKSIAYGAIKNRSEDWVKTLITLLVAEGFIKEYSIQGGNGFTISNTKRSLEWIQQYKRDPVNTKLLLPIPEMMQTPVKKTK